MIYEDEARWAGLSEDERDAIRDRYNGFTQKVREAGVMVGGNALGSTGDATTVRVRDEETGEEHEINARAVINATGTWTRPFWPIPTRVCLPSLPQTIWIQFPGGRRSGVLGPPIRT